VMEEASVAGGTILLLGAGSALPQSTTGFENPPNGARLRLWWYWTNGNIPKEVSG
jgi:hypothetical protein